MKPAPSRLAGDRALAAQRHFARSWADAVAGTSFVSLEQEELVTYLSGLTSSIVEQFRAPVFEPSAMRAIGVDLVAAHFTGTETLSRSVALLDEHLVAIVGPTTAEEPRRRLGRAVGEIAAGYAGALRERVLDEQEQIRSAVLVAIRAAEQRLAASEARFRAMFTDAAIGIGIGDLSGNILDANPALLLMLGYTADQLALRNVAQMVHPEDAPSVWNSYARLVTGELEHFRIEKRFFRADGEAIWTHLTVSLVRDEDGRPAYQVAMLEDISDRRRLQESLEHLAYHDPLTGLPNRASFAARLAELFVDPQSDGRVGMCLLDLDGLKTINDSRGHEVGDQVLVQIGERLVRCGAGSHLVARLGGDEFVILMVGTASVDEVAGMAELVLSVLPEPIRVAGHEMSVSASIGVVEQPVGATTPADLMAAADITLALAKSSGKARHAVFDRARTDEQIARFTLASTMPAAIVRDEFLVHYQPIVTLADGTLRGVEALIRWQHPDFGLLVPGRFIAVAEETGAIVALGRWVLAQACEQGRAWHVEFGDGAPFVSVNLAPRQLQESALVADVAGILADTGLPAEFLQLELTEQAVMRDEVDSLAALHALSRMGVRIAIDDFGTGYSNLSYLRRLPVSGLKLDGSFVEGLDGSPPADPTDELIVSALVTLAHALGLTVVAEGVETAEQCDRLRSIGCDTGQGWLFAPALPASEISAMIRRGTPFGDRDSTACR